MRIRTTTPALLVALAAAACGVDGGSGDAPTATTATSDVVIEVEVEELPAGGSVAPVDDGRVPVIVDYSPTTSDVAALLYVTQHPSAHLVAVTLAGTGESHCDRGVANTRALLAVVGMSDVPVACGQEQPVGPGNEWPGDWRQAADRLDGLDLPPVETAGGEAGAAELLASTAADRGRVTIVALGPLTNLAVAIDGWPDLSEHVTQVVTMGGAVDVAGNATNGAAEWNYFIDPSAVDVVLRSGIPVTMVPLDATNSVPVTRSWFDALAGHRTSPAAQAVHDLFAASRPYDSGFSFWDELAAAVALDPTFVTLEEQAIVIDLDGAEQGRTRIDAAGTEVQVAVAADRERFERDLLTTLNGGVAPPSITTASADEIEYLGAVEAAVLELGAAIETLFQTPVQRELEEIERRAADGELTPADGATIRGFLTEFWTGADGHVQTFRDDVGELDPPESVRREHDEYVGAIDALIDSTDDRLDEIATGDPTELLGSLWEPTEEIEAMTAACEALASTASGLGIDARTCPD